MKFAMKEKMKRVLERYIHINSKGFLSFTTFELYVYESSILNVEVTGLGFFVQFVEQSTPQPKLFALSLSSLFFAC